MCGRVGCRRPSPAGWAIGYGGLQIGGFSRSVAGMTRPDVLDEIAVVSSICRELGLGEVTPAMLKAAHHTTFLISPLEIVARVQSAEPVDTAWRRAAGEIAAARHLAERGAPALVPLGALAGPHVAASSVVTFWPHVEHRGMAGDGDAALAAATLAAVHRALLDYDGELPPYTQALFCSGGMGCSGWIVPWPARI